MFSIQQNWKPIGQNRRCPNNIHMQVNVKTMKEKNFYNDYALFLV
jgi:hypothetical protein